MKSKTSRAHDGLKPTQLLWSIAFLACLSVVMPNPAYPRSQGKDAKATKSETFPTLPAGTSPIAIALEGADIWVANLPDNSVTKLRSRDGSKLGTFKVGTHPFALCSDGPNVWVANSDSGNVTKLRASDGTVLGTFAAGSRPGGVLCDGRNIWVADTEIVDGRLRLRDLQSLEVLAGGPEREIALAHLANQIVQSNHTL